MKRVLLVVPALICGVMLNGCGSKDPQDEKTLGELYAMGTKSITVTSKDEMDLLFTVDDIISYNIVEVPLIYGKPSGQIVFTDKKANDLKEHFEEYPTVFFFLHGELVFDPPVPTFFPWLTSEPPSGLHLRYERSNYGDVFYLTEIYSIGNLPDDETKEKRKKQLDVFIKYLRDVGKIIE